MSEKTLLQDQFSKRKRARRSGIEQQRCNASRPMLDKESCLNRKIRGAELRIIAYPIFGFRENKSAQDLAALHLGRLFLFCRLGMERALGLRLVDFRCDRRESAMIRNRNPRADRYGNNRTAESRVHVLQIVSAAQVLKFFLLNQ